MSIHTSHLHSSLHQEHLLAPHQQKRAVSLLSLDMVKSYRMTKPMGSLAATLLWYLATRARAANDEHHATEKVQCNTYLANSTIPNAGLGIFSAIELKIGDIVGNGDVCIPIIDLDLHQGEPFNPFADYVWGGEVMGMRFEAIQDVYPDTEAFCPGLDCAINCNLALLNVEKATPLYDDAGLHRATDPGAGAITPYHNGTTAVYRDVPAGGELFKDYGTDWFTTRAIFDTLPLWEHFEDAQELIDDFAKLNLSDAAKRDLYEGVIVDIRSMWNVRAINAMPQTYDDAMIAIEHDIGMPYQPNATRSAEWLQTNGKCVDHIVPKISRLPHAGHGAFAKRDLPKGTVLTGSPLHHLPFGKTKFMEMFSQIPNRHGGYPTKGGEVVSHQVIMNYCFSHRDTTMLLCPYGAGVNYINHNQTLANVNVVWASHGVTSHNDEALRKTPEELQGSLRSTLGLDYVVTRDIKEGEEVYLDYGDEFESAWQEHLDHWRADASETAYLHARAFNERFGNESIRMDDELENNPYPDNIEIRCHTDLVRDTIWRREPNKTWDWELSEYGYECLVYDRYVHDTGETLYDIALTTGARNRWDHDNSRRYDLHYVPREAIAFFDVPESSDLHLRGAFRHPLGLPDSLMREPWRNVDKDDQHGDPSEKNGAGGEL